MKKIQLANEAINLDGVILFRGFPVKEAAAFSEFVGAFRFPNPHREIGLAGKRSVVAENIKTANEEPPDVKFYYHSEYGRSANFPGILFFFSEIVPEQGIYCPYFILGDMFDTYCRRPDTDTFILGALR